MPEYQCQLCAFVGSGDHSCNGAKFVTFDTDPNHKCKAEFIPLEDAFPTYESFVEALQERGILFLCGEDLVVTRLFEDKSNEE